MGFKKSSFGCKNTSIEFYIFFVAYQKKLLQILAKNVTHFNILLGRRSNKKKRPFFGLY